MVIPVCEVLPASLVDFLLERGDQLLVSVHADRLFVQCFTLAGGLLYRGSERGGLFVEELLSIRLR